MELQPQGRRISGSFVLGYQDDEMKVDLKCSISGGLLHDRFLQLDYHADNQAMTNFGTAILALSSEGTHLTGHFVGYGARADQIVCGDIELARVP